MVNVAVSCGLKDHMSLNMPNVICTGPLEYVFTLERNGPKTYYFVEHHVEIVRDHQRNVNINGPVDQDGYMYFIEASPEIGESTFIWLSKSEASILMPQLMKESARGWTSTNCNKLQ